MPSFLNHSARAPAEKSSSSDGRSRRWRYGPPVLLMLAAAGLLAYVYWPRIDHKDVLDRQIQEEWMPGREVVDALKFFDGGGTYKSDARTDAAGLDRDYVVPLLKRLRDEHHLRVTVILRDDVPNTVLALLAEAPASRAARNAVRTTILEAADGFPGLVLQNWSHQWVSLDFLDAQEMTAFKPQTLARLKASQRRME
jgi:hypothetical protein